MADNLPPPPPSPPTFVPTDHPAAMRLWEQVVAGHRARIRNGANESAIGYARGLTDGLSNAYSTITGMTRQDVGDRAKADATR